MSSPFTVITTSRRRSSSFGRVASIRRLFLLLALCALALALGACGPGQSGTNRDEEAATEDELVRDLRQGGYNIYFRHAATVQSQDDFVNNAGDWTSCDPDLMRQLSEEGRLESRAIGNDIRALDIPVGPVVASEYCRSAQTTQLMDLGEVETTTDILNTNVAEYVGGQSTLSETTRQRLGNPSESGTNTILVGHNNNLSAAADVPLLEGEAAIFEPQGDGQFSLVTTVDLEAWTEWANE